MKSIKNSPNRKTKCISKWSFTVNNFQEISNMPSTYISDMKKSLSSIHKMKNYVKNWLKDLYPIIHGWKFLTKRFTPKKSIQITKPWNLFVKQTTPPRTWIPLTKILLMFFTSWALSHRSKKWKRKLKLTSKKFKIQFEMKK